MFSASNLNSVVKDHGSIIDNLNNIYYEMNIHCFFFGIQMTFMVLLKWTHMDLGVVDMDGTQRRCPEIGLFSSPERSEYHRFLINRDGLSGTASGGFN